MKPEKTSPPSFQEKSFDGKPKKLGIITVDGKPFEPPPEGSLGLLALGWRGLLAWREQRKAAGKEPPKAVKKPSGKAPAAKADNRPKGQS